MGITYTEYRQLFLSKEEFKRRCQALPEHVVTDMIEREKCNTTVKACMFAFWKGKDLMDNGSDKDGGLTLTYDVSVVHNGKRVLLLGCGIRDVEKFFDLAQAGITGAIKTDFLFSYNVLVRLNGESLVHLIEAYYPELIKKAETIIIPEEEYVIDCYDMS